MFLGDSGGHFSYSFQVPLEEEDWFALTGVALVREAPAAESPAKKPTAALMFFTAGLASFLPLSLLLFPFIKMKGVFRSLQSRDGVTVCVCVCAGGLEHFRSSPPLSPSPNPAGAQTVCQVRPSLRDQGGNTAWDFTVVGASTL